MVIGSIVRVPGCVVKTGCALLSPGRARMDFRMLPVFAAAATVVFVCGSSATPTSLLCAVGTLSTGHVYARRLAANAMAGVALGVGTCRPSIAYCSRCRPRFSGWSEVFLGSVGIFFWSCVDGPGMERQKRRAGCVSSHTVLIQFTDNDRAVSSMRRRNVGVGEDAARRDC